MACWSVDDFRLTICCFSFKGWKVWWCGKGIDNNVDVFGGRGECFRKSGPHAPSASRADGDVGVSMLVGEGEEGTDGAAVDVENVL